MEHKLTVHVKAGSRKGPLVEQGPDGSLIVYVREQAVDGKANAAVIKMLAENFGVPKTSVEITHGHTSKFKQVIILNQK